MFDFSVIIPHKDSPELLERCLSSIPQCYNIQIIVVDDNSLHTSVIILKELSKKYQNVCFIYTTDSKGAGYGRNVGLKYAKGKWVIFADSDDFFLDGAFLIFDEYKKSLYDIIYFEPYSIYSDTRIPAERHLYYKKMVDDFHENNVNAIDRLRYNFGVPWCKMISRSLIEKNVIRFDEIKFSNDVMFSLKIGYYAKVIYAVSKPVYCVTVTEGSLVNRHSKASLKCRYEVVLRQNAFLRSIGKSKYQKSIMHYLRQSIQYGLFTLFEFVEMALSTKTNFFIGYRHWIRNFFNSNRLNRINKRYIVKE